MESLQELVGILAKSLERLEFLERNAKTPRKAKNETRRCACGNKVLSVDDGDTCAPCKHEADNSIPPF